MRWQPSHLRENWVNNSIRWRRPWDAVESSGKSYREETEIKFCQSRQTGHEAFWWKVAFWNKRRKKDFCINKKVLLWKEAGWKNISHWWAERWGYIGLFSCPHKCYYHKVLIQCWTLRLSVQSGQTRSVSLSAQLLLTCRVLPGWFLAVAAPALRGAATLPNTASTKKRRETVNCLFTLLYVHRQLVAGKTGQGHRSPSS